MYPEETAASATPTSHLSSGYKATGLKMLLEPMAATSSFDASTAAIVTSELVTT
jgi:hypothetical protein